MIQRLWDNRIETCSSCQDNFGYVWVEFLSAEDVLGFLNIIVVHGDAELANRASEPYDISPGDAADRLAEYDARPDSWLIAANVTKYDDANEVYMSLGIRFPRDHLTRVVDALHMKYHLPIDSYEHAAWCLAEAQRRYRGKVVLDEDSKFPLIEDAAGTCNTDDVLRTIGAEFGPKLVGKYRFWIAAAERAG